MLYLWKSYHSWTTQKKNTHPSGWCHTDAPVGHRNMAEKKDGTSQSLAGKGKNHIKPYHQIWRPQTNKQTNEQTNKQKKQTNKQTNKQPTKQTNKQNTPSISTWLIPSTHPPYQPVSGLNISQLLEPCDWRKTKPSSWCDHILLDPPTEPPSPHWWWTLRQRCCVGVEVTDTLPFYWRHWKGHGWNWTLHPIYFPFWRMVDIHETSTGEPIFFWIVSVKRAMSQESATLNIPQK